MESVSFSKPAYKSPPPSPLALYQLRPRVQTKLSVVAREGGRPTTVVEVFAGSAVTTQELVRMGFIGRAYENATEGARGMYLPEGDIERPENQHELAGLLTVDKVLRTAAHGRRSEL